MLTSQFPYSGSGPSIYVDHLQSPIPRVSAIRPDLPLALDLIVIDALAKNPAERFKSSNILLKSFQTAIIPPSPRPIVTPTPKPAAPKPSPVVEAKEIVANRVQQPVRNVKEAIANQKGQQPGVTPQQQQGQIGVQAKRGAPSPRKKTLTERRQAFIERIYPISPSTGIWLLPLFFLIGLGPILDTYTQYQYAIIVMATVALLGYPLAYRKTTSFSTFILILFFSCAVFFLLSEKVLHLFLITQQDGPVQTSVWLLGPRDFWTGRQVNAGLIIGSITAFIMYIGFFFFSGRDSFLFTITLTLIFCICSIPIWLIASILAIIFNWGFGFGDSWYLGLLYQLIGIIAAIGLADFIYVSFRRFE